MRKYFLTAILSLLAMTAYAQDRADRQNLENPDSFSMIVLGDPQGYVKYDVNQPLFELCTAWIADNIDHLKIKAVLCTGDVVEQNDNFVLNRRSLNQTSEEMYKWGAHCFGRLDGKVPYFISPGNHEYGFKKAENGNTNFPQYFPFSKNPCWKDIVISSFPGRSGVNTIENSAYELDLPNWGRMIIITTEFAPRDEVLAWAKDVCDKHPEDRVIFMTHSILREKTAEIIKKESYRIEPRNWGIGVWEKLLKTTPNIVFALCGHTGRPAEGTKNGAPDDYELSCAYRCDKNDAGRDLHQMMFNVQIVGGGWEGNGGDGWLRILEFCPDGRTVKVKTYSPLFGISHMTKHLAHRTGACDQFEMVLAEPIKK